MIFFGPLIAVEEINVNFSENHGPGSRKEASSSRSSSSKRRTNRTPAKPLIVYVSAVRNVEVVCMSGMILWLSALVNGGTWEKKFSVGVIILGVSHF